MRVVIGLNGEIVKIYTKGGLINIGYILDQIQELSPLENTITTTDGTSTIIATIPIAASTTVMVEAKVVARRTGGSAGTAEDGAGYMVVATWKNVAGVATDIGSASIFSAEDQAGWSVSVDKSGSDGLIRVTGATNNNITWFISYKIYSI
jgi:hypothetical protein